MDEPSHWSGHPLRSGGRIRGTKGMMLRGKDDSWREQVAQGEDTGTPWEEETLSMQNPKSRSRSAGHGHKATSQSS